MNILQILKSNINTLYVRYLGKNEIEDIPIYYIGGNQNLPHPLTSEEEEEDVYKSQGLMCLVLFTVMFMQFKTIEETDITAIENMRESELRTAISEWKTKYEETNTTLEETQKSINEYKSKLDKNEEASELVDQELQESNMLLGKTDVYGEGVVVTLSDNEQQKIKASDLIVLINELKYGGAEAISINDIRITNDTAIAFIDNSYIIIGSEQRISSPYVVKAIGNITYLSSAVSYTHI